MGPRVRYDDVPRAVDAVTRAALALAVLASGCFSTRGKTAAFVVGEVAIACDYAMTSWMTRHPNYSELNPLLGAHPSAATIAAVSASALAINALIYALPESVVPRWLKAGWLPYVALVEVANDAYFNPAPHTQCAL